MVIKIVFNHIFKYPVEVVAQTHLTKYPNDREPNVIQMDTVEKRIESDDVEYHRRIATCLNVIPNILRRINTLDVPRIHIEEQAWIDRRRRKMVLESKNITWAQYAHLWETSVFKPVKEQPHWTQFEQNGVIDVHGLGPFGRIIEMFAEKFLRKGMQKSLDIMENILRERESNIAAAS